MLWLATLKDIELFKAIDLFKRGMLTPMDFWYYFFIQINESNVNVALDSLSDWMINSLKNGLKMNAQVKGSKLDQGIKFMRKRFKEG